MPTTPPIVLQRPLIPGNVRDTSLQQPLKVAQDALNALQARADAATTGTVTDIETSGPITGGPITSTGTIGFNPALFAGPLFWPVVNTTTYTVLANDVVIFSDASGGDTTIILPNPASNTNRVLMIRRTSAVNNVNLTPSSGTIETLATVQLGSAAGYAGSTVFSVILISTGSDWKSVAWDGKTA